MIDLGSSKRAKVRQNDIRAKSTIYLTSSFSILFSGSEAGLLQSADYAVLITNSTANGRVAGQIDGVEDGILEVIEPDMFDPKKFVPFRLININFRDATSDSIPALVDEHSEAMVYCLNEISLSRKGCFVVFKLS